MTPADRARGLVGVAYRAGGRDQATGLDCLGLALLCYAIEGKVPVRDGGRGLSNGQIRALLEQRFEPARHKCDGDLVVMRSVRRWHLGIARGAALIHADARARRVVMRCGDAPWPVFGRYRDRKGYG